MNKQRFCWTLSLLIGLVALTVAAGTAWAQSGSQGTITVTVVDVSGGAVPQTTLNLVDLATNYSRKATANENGEYTFVNLSIGVYKLTAVHPDYSTALIDHVEVHASLTTDVKVALKVGAQSESIEVKADVTPLMEVTANAIGSVVDLKEIEDLPMSGRDLASLATLTPGYGGYNGTGSWNGQPLISQGSNIDGTNGTSSRMKGTTGGNAEPAVSPRVETIAEMTVQTDQLDLDQGFGQAVSQTNYVSRRGSNKYHGRVFENFHNSGLDANTWSNDVTHLSKSKQIYNDFGGSAGGPIFKDKLFFFGSMAMRKVPGAFTAHSWNSGAYPGYSSGVLTTDAQQGNFTYTGTDGNTYTKNLLTIAQGNSLPYALNSQVSTQLDSINKSLSSGVTSATTGNPNVNDLTWNNTNSQSLYFPSARVDYDLSARLRMNLTWSMTDNTQPGQTAAPYPTMSNMVAGTHVKGYTSSYGVDWTATPSLVNQFKMGFLYNATFNNYNSAPLYKTEESVNWGMGNSGQTYQAPITSYYPQFDLTDTVTLQKGGHTLKAGFTGYHEQDHYWNAPTGFPTYSLGTGGNGNSWGLAAGDPAINAFSGSSGAGCASSGSLPCASGVSLTEAGALYATLTGRISGVSGQYSYSKALGDYQKGITQYALDEVSMAWGLFAQDSWRFSPTLTFNYGLRWDFTGASTDKSGLYHSSDPSSIYGPSSALFQPGTLGGNLNPKITVNTQPYAPFHVTPQPAFGLAWNPKGLDGILGRLAGDGKMVIRAGYSLRRFTEPYQYYWNNASTQGSYFYQNFTLQPSNSGTTGTFAPGSLALGSSLPAYLYAPATYMVSEPQSDYTFKGNCPGCGSGGGTPGVTGIDPHIQQPYTQTWNLGIQRQFGSRALEIRYAGNRSIHQWVNHDTNEVNVFENGFLAEFKHAQANLAAYQAANPNCGQTGYPDCSFANNGLAGQVALPIIEAALTGASSDYSNSTFLTNLANGEVGALAQAFAGTGTTNYFCNLVGSSFAPCGANGYTGGVGADKPINFFQANPYATGQETQYMVAAGYSNYHSLQVELRQQQWKGLQFDANYTLSHTLGFQVNTNGVSAYGFGCGGYNGWCDWPGTLTLRNLRLAYGPAQYDIRQALHASGTYDLPVGRGKLLLNGNNLADRMLGNWTVGTVLTFQTGTAQQIIGNNLTYNDYGDGGVVLNNVTVSQLQKSVGVHRVPGKTRALLLDPKYLTSSNGSGHANSSYITPNTTPGTINHPIYLYGPHAFYNDISLSKAFPIYKDLRFKLQAEATNAWNHPVFGNTSGSMRSSVQNPGFATAAITNLPRVIEFRANIDF